MIIAVYIGYVEITPWPHTGISNTRYKLFDPVQELVMGGINSTTMHRD